MSECGACLSSRLKALPCTTGCMNNCSCDWLLYISAYVLNDPLLDRICVRVDTGLDRDDNVNAEM